jgi:sialate O-acetylesterase
MKLTALSCPPHHAPQKLVVRGADGETSRNDILTGDVWLCGGQSNMAFKLNRATDGAAVAAAANDPQLRLCRPVGMRSTVGDPPPADLASADWRVATPGTVSDFSAVGYFFGQALRKSIGVPIGLIDTSVGGTPMRCWMSRGTLENDPQLRPLVDEDDRKMKDYPKLLESYHRQLASYEERLKKGEAKPAGKPIAPKGPDSSYRMSYFHDSVIRLLQPSAIKGVIWYQGEANASRYAVFEHQFATLIGEWRREWGQPEQPWLYVQLAPYSAPNGRLFPRAWEAQATAQKIPHTAMVVALDVGQADNIHPPNKKPIGERLAHAARSVAYGEPITWRVPEFQSMKIHDKEIILHFNGLISPPATPDTNLSYFKIAAADEKWTEAKAHLQSDGNIVVSAPNIDAPIAVRYGWYNLHEPVGASLFSQDRLPVPPFRTDDWPDKK